MAETQLKRQREEEEAELEFFKRQKSYKDILSILEEDEDEPNQDLSSLITTLQQEICSPDRESSIKDQIYLSSSSSSYSYSQKEEEEEEEEKVMRHLLEASDDELGIPNAEEATPAVDGFDGGMSSLGEIDGGDLLLPVSVDGGDGLWEIQDEAANYYALLQSELFM